MQMVVYCLWWFLFVYVQIMFGVALIHFIHISILFIDVMVIHFILILKVRLSLMVVMVMVFFVLLLVFVQVVNAVIIAFRLQIGPFVFVPVLFVVGFLLIITFVQWIVYVVFAFLVASRWLESTSAEFELKFQLFASSARISWFWAVCVLLNNMQNRTGQSEWPEGVSWLTEFGWRTNKFAIFHDIVTCLLREYSVQSCLP